MKQELPQFFHIGLPKTGTTTIQEVFRNDQRINLIRGLCFNTPDYWLNDFDLGIKENLIVQSADRGKLYMTLSRIARVAPEAKIVLTIREQRAMMVSRYKYNFPYWDGFTKSLEDWLKSGQGMDYLSMCMYGSLYKTIRSFFPPENIHFLYFEDLKSDFTTFFNDLYKLLGINIPDNLNTNIKKNVTRSDQELLLIKKLNRFKIFNNGSKISLKEAKLIENIANKYAKKEKKKIFKWGETDFFKRIENDFTHENNLATMEGFLDLEKLKKYGYLV